MCVSVKIGLNCEKVLDVIVDYVFVLKDVDDNKLLKVLIFDLYFDEYCGVIMFIRVF